MDRFEDAKLRIKEATDLVALIESYLPLRPRGRTLVALCPFHAENSPSFTVFRDTQHFHCFGCQKTGDVFTWLMERDGHTFREAMEVLADRAGISLEGVFKGRQGNEPKGPDPYEVLAEVARVLAPGGRLVLTDIFERFPRKEVRHTGIDKFCRDLMSTTADIDDYVPMLHRAGLRVREVLDVTEQTTLRLAEELAKLSLGGERPAALDEGNFHFSDDDFKPSDLAGVDDFGCLLVTAERPR